MNFCYKTYKKKWIFSLACFIFAMMMTACGNADFIGNSYKTGNSITIEYLILNTTETEEIDLKSGDKVKIDVKSKYGQTDIEFGIKDVVPDYEGKSVESGSFTVTVHKDGRYVLTVTGVDAVGSVKLAKEEFEVKKCS